MCDNNNPSTQSIADYLAQLLKDRKQLAAFPNVFMHMERLLDEGRSKSCWTIYNTSADERTSPYRHRCLSQSTINRMRRQMLQRTRY